MPRGSARPEPKREDRRSAKDQVPLAKSRDVRSSFQRDRDRILYSEYFQRLSGVTQVASAAEGGVFHNRMTHSLKVAQVGRRLAESLLLRNSRKYNDLKSLLNPDVVEAACLGHDLGHPPFGHVADHRLCELAEANGLDDGFEGNAQTFRIISRLAVRPQDQGLGLDLTRATMAALAKYPWERAKRNAQDKEGRKRHKKFSFYADDKAAASFAMSGAKDGQQSLECQVMDKADSITYSVHDLEDFYRAGLIPVERLLRNKLYRRSFLERWARDEPDRGSQVFAQDEAAWNLDSGAIGGFLYLLLADGAEPGSRAESVHLDGFRSRAITELLDGISLTKSKAGFEVNMKPFLEHLCRVMQRLIWHYVILTPRLATQQAGQIKIIDNLFNYFNTALNEKRLDRLPTRFRDEAQQLVDEKAAEPSQTRMSIDMVATLTEAEAMLLHKRISGYDGGSVLDTIN